MKLYKLYCSC